MAIDVIIANYNHSTFLENSLKRLLNQTCKPSKIILIDDASTDNSLEIINKLLEDFTNIHFIKNETNVGACEVYNIGLEFVESEYVYFAAADDILSSNFFEKSIELLRQYENVAFTCGKAIKQNTKTGLITSRPIILPKIKNRPMSSFDVSKEFFDNDNWIMTGTCVYRKSFIIEHNKFDCALNSFADGFLAKELAFEFGCIFIDEFFLVWRIDGNNYSLKIFQNLDEFYALLSTLFAKINYNKNFPDWYWSKYEKRLQFMLINNRLKQTFVNSKKRYFQLNFFVYSVNLLKLISNFIMLCMAYWRYKPFSFFRYLTNILHKRGSRGFYELLMQKDH